MKLTQNRIPGYGVPAIETYEAGDYLMISKLSIQNFRCFKSVKVENLKRINIIVGDSASGKTALLEAIKMGLDGLPSTIPWFFQIRNLLMALPTPPSQSQFESVFADFFHLSDIRNKIQISMEDSENRSAHLLIYFDPARAVTTQPQLIGFQPHVMALPGPSVTITPLAFDRTNFQNQNDILLATVNIQGVLQLQPGKNMGLVSGLVGAGQFGGPGEAALWLSQLSIQKQAENFIKRLRRHFPFIHKLTVEIPSPGQGSIYADVGIQRMIPLTLVSAGASRIFFMMLATAQFSRGVVLIDEVEDGVFYEQYPLLWKTLIDLAKSNQTQLFISSHSKECLVQAVPVIAQTPDDFFLLKLRLENCESFVECFGGEEFRAALEKEGEIRH